MIRLAIAHFAGAALMLGVITCSERGTDPGAPVASVSVSLSRATTGVGQPVTATATLRGADGQELSGRAVSWSSSNPAVATISSGAQITSLAVGNATITATSEGQSGSAALSVVAFAPEPVATVAVTLPGSALLAGTTAQASVTLRDAGNNVLVDRSVTWSTDNAAVATVSATGIVTAVAAGTAHIIATSEGRKGSALVMVSASSSYNGSAEPTGMTVITERPFAAVVEDGWLLPTWAAPFFTTVQDATAPKSPGSVAQVRFPSGWTGGDSPALEEKDLSAAARTLYVSMWMKLSPNWVGHPTGTNKVIHLWIDGINRVFAFADGGGNNELTPRIGLQQIAGAYDDGFGDVATGVDLRPNVAGQTGVQIVRGRWHRWEIVLRSNTGGGANGSVDWWLDGVLVGHYTGIQYVRPGASNTWDIIKFDPTWGGLGGTLPAEQFMYMDHLYISGKP